MKIRRVVGAIAASVMFTVMSVGTCFAANAGIKDGAAGVTVNETVVGFAGHEWWVIGEANSGVYKNADSVTLLAKNNNFGNVEFRKQGAAHQEGYKQYYTDWFEGSFANYPSDYKGSTVQRKMESVGNGFGEKERNKINGRTLTKTDDIGLTGTETVSDIENQKLWAISEDELSDIGNRGIRSFGNYFWLRSSDFDSSSYVGFADGGSHSNLTVNSMCAVRPALNLNLKSVILTSDAKGASAKSSASPGGGLVSAISPATTGTNNKIKYTFKDDSLKLQTAYVSRLENGTATVKYSGASPGKTLSVIVKNSSGAVTHYGKLAENITASGEASFALPNGFNPSADKIEIFVEEINGEDESDFASTPKELDMTVKNMVYVTNGTGGGLYEQGEQVKLTANTPDNDKYFKGWNISPAVTLTEGTNISGIIKFNMPGEDVTATAEYGTVYRVKNGQNSTWKQGSGDGLTITSEGEFSRFTGVSVGGNTLDKSQYDKKGGSTVITLKPSYLSILSVGEHIMRIHFTDGYTETKFSIAEAAQEPKVPETTVAPGETTTVQPIETTAQPTETTAAPGEDTSPKTGDKNKLWLTLALMVGTGIVFVIINSVKKNKESAK